MIKRFVDVPLRFWFRTAVTVSGLWFVVAGLLQWAILQRAAAAASMRHIAGCQISRIADPHECISRAVTQLDISRANAIPLAFLEAVTQVALLWLIGAIALFGMRWAARALY